LLALAARVIGLDIAGIDLVAADIGRPLREQGGAILEVNAMPGLLMHLKPAAGEPRRVDEMIVASLYPPGEVGRIPVVAVESGPGAARVARLLGERLARAGFTAGVACAEGTFVQGVETRSGNCATARHAADLLLHPLLDAAVVEVRLDSIREEGLGFDRCDALVLASLEEDAAHQALRSTLPPGGALAASLEEDPARQALRSTLAPGGALAVARADESPEDFAARVALPFLPA
jgi:cyanophycin synthetase